MDLDEYFTLLKDYGNLSVMSIEDLHELLGEDKERIVRYVMDESDDPEKCAEFYEIEKILAKELDKLPERQKYVLSLYYHEDMNMKEIAGVLGITEARICQIHSQAIINLRVTMKKYLTS
jgi:RNA polymerase sigma factor for flagellar operon FliA